ncbi:MAG: ABC transporter substrate-binding protein [Clostridia bacterium]
MKKLGFLCAGLVAVLLLAYPMQMSARAEEVTLKTMSIFAGTDVAANTYAKLLKQWQEQTGYAINDFSATSDEAWKSSVLKDFAAGNEADVLFFFAKTPESATILNKVVPISEINAAYPGLNLKRDADMTECDGEVYAIPVRPYWEGLFCNIDLFERYGVELPTSWEKLEAAITAFNNVGIVPISVSLSDVPHYLAEFSILCSASHEEYAARPAANDPVPQSWIEGMRLIRKLYEMNAFPKNASATTEAFTSQLFRDKKAAMQIDGSWFANSIKPGSMNTTVVLPFPAYSEKADSTAYIYGVSMGFYLTRAAWKDDLRRDAAVDLLHFLTKGINAAALCVYDASGLLLESYQKMVNDAQSKNLPIQDDMQPDARRRWFAAIPGIADGSVDPAALWAEIMEMNPFPTKWMYQ